ncbi:hypothetical protein ARALYDRAFT_915733 [Arabidopsis lyrata subsp. lyrata]|uniref:Uncharacterized protein n=1 Tax=Arabidopsis lyrata subsp. lyrata TaxID=81972 RepID=D7MHY4_ARALL|nr:hypothetical protein ARALYDRAFT_915733 [Arabidopsis lyrata subsp. lyrata]
MEGTVDERIGSESPPDDFGSFIHDPEYLELRDMVRKHSAEAYDRHGWTVSDDMSVCRAHLESGGSDFCQGMRDGEFLVRYDIGLCGRLGLYCYNFQKGKNLEFEGVRRIYTQYASKVFFTMEAVDPADNYSLYSLRTWVKHDEHADTVLTTWETCFCDVKDGEEADREWDNEAIDDRYKGEMPKWFSDDDLQHCYVLNGSEMMDPNLHLFAEFAFYKKWCQRFWPEDIAGCLPLVIQKVVVKTRGEAETEPPERLKAANAIFYICFKCVYDPVTGEEANYRAVVRKTMDGKPGHMRLEVICLST